MRMPVRKPVRNLCQRMAVALRLAHDRLDLVEPSGEFDDQIFLCRVGRSRAGIDRAEAVIRTLTRD
jgi:hypothetical protein